MPVYVFREGTSNSFKIGLTRSSDVEPRRRQLNGGSSQGLFLFEVVETDNESACEAFFHRLLSTRRIVRGGGREFFEMDSEEHMRQTIEQFRDMAAKLENARLAIADFEQAECDSVMLEPIVGDKELLSKLQAVEARLLEIKEETEYLEFEREVIQSQLKQRIGGSRGIRGVATWETKVRRNFSEELLRARDPDLYKQLLARFQCLDTKAWRTQQPAHYKQIQTAYFIPSITRKFEILG
jgi:T5orf172 domain